MMDKDGLGTPPILLFDSWVSAFPAWEWLTSTFPLFGAAYNFLVNLREIC